MIPEINENFEDSFVHKFYDLKSDKFSKSRVCPWPFTKKFLNEYSNDSSLVLDAGCGNGRSFLHKSSIGLDYSFNLLLDARNKTNLGLVKSNVLEMPFKEDSFDVVLSVAVIHHLSTNERRMKALEEMKRVMKKGGVILLYTWHLDASKKKKFHPAEGKNDFFVSWKGEEDLLRYYHLYDEEGLTKLCESSGMEIIEIGREQESIYAVLRK